MANNATTPAGYGFRNNGMPMVEVEPRVINRETRELEPNEFALHAMQWDMFPGHPLVPKLHLPLSDPIHGGASNGPHAVYLGGKQHKDAPKNLRNKNCIQLLDNHGIAQTHRGPQIVCPSDWVVFRDDSETEVLDVISDELFHRLFGLISN